jgi:hypothetical protein
MAFPQSSGAIAPALARTPVSPQEGGFAPEGSGGSGRVLLDFEDRVLWRFRQMRKPREQIASDSSIFEDAV